MSLCLHGLSFLALLGVLDPRLIMRFQASTRWRTRSKHSPIASKTRARHHHASKHASTPSPAKTSPRPSPRFPDTPRLENEASDTSLWRPRLGSDTLTDMFRSVSSPFHQIGISRVSITSHLISNTAFAFSDVVHHDGHARDTVAILFSTFIFIL